MKIAFELLKVFENYEKAQLVESSFEKLDVVVSEAKALVKGEQSSLQKILRTRKTSTLWEVVHLSERPMPIQYVF
jgi:hypothetical protein